MLERIIGVFKLDVNTYEEIEHDENATSQAAIVVAIVAILSGIGSGILASFNDGNFIISFIGALIWAFVGWFLWSAATYFIGTTLFDGRATMGEMLRVIGFAQAPQILGIIPCIGILGWIWSLVTGFIAVRQGLDLDNTKSAITIAVGAIIYLIGWFIINGTTAFAGGMFG